MSEEQNINKLTKRYKRILETVILHKNTAIEGKNVNRVQWYGEEYTLIGWDVEFYQKTIEEIRKMYSKISTVTIESFFSQNIIKMLMQNAIEENIPLDFLQSNYRDINESVINKNIADFHSSLQSLIKLHTVFIPLEGIEFHLPQLKIGDIMIYPNTGGMLPKLINTPETHYSSQHCGKKLVKGGCYLVAKIEGDERFAREQAFKKARNIIHILNLYIGSCKYRQEHKHIFWDTNNYTGFSDYPKQKIGIWGASSTNDQVFYSATHEPHPFHSEIKVQFHFKLSKPAFFTTPQLYDASEELHKELGTRRDWLHQIDDKILTKLQEMCLYEIVKVFDFNSKLDRRIATSVIWYSKAINGDNSSVRSKIVHEGEDVSTTDLYSMEDIVKKLL